jgi:hypothetical protein
MPIFQPITLAWHGEEFVIPASQVLPAIAIVEEIVTFPELVRMRSVNPNFSKIARAFGALLRFAGVRVSDEEVYGGLFKEEKTVSEVLTAIDAMVAIMMPPNAIAKAGAASEGNLVRAKTARSRLSKPSSKRRSAAAG